MVRASVRWEEKGGGGRRKYMCNLESTNHTNNTIFKVTKITVKFFKYKEVVDRVSRFLH